VERQKQVPAQQWLQGLGRRYTSEVRRSEAGEAVGNRTSFSKEVTLGLRLDETGKGLDKIILKIIWKKTQEL
jgi:hypothetical protein